MAGNLSKNGVSFVLEWETKNGREPKDVSQNRNFIGFDIMSIDNNGKNHRTIEVKSTEVKADKSFGIPDAFETEFTRRLKFVATHLYVVVFEKKSDTVSSLHVIPKEEIDKYSKKHIIVQHIKFASELQTRLNNDEFKQPA